MANGERAMHYASFDDRREDQFKHVWHEELNDVFADVAKYYDRANYVASLGLWGWFRRNFISMIDVQPGQQVLDVCAGTNAIAIALLKKQPALKVTAIDRSEAMQEVGRKNAEKLALHIENVIHDVHQLPFPDNHFDVVTLQFASRHLRIYDVTTEIMRVLKPGGKFYHSDMLRPASDIVGTLYFTYLRGCLAFTALVFRSGSAAVNCRRYFIDALQMFYSADEFDQLLHDVGFQNVTHKTLFAGMLGFHEAAKGSTSGMA
jgi:demethylmenaquinone methyltransferase/2-methoxy-6-polyprenyl-1,4-benzoquinol methylase